MVEELHAAERSGLTAGSIYLCVHSGSRGFGEAILRNHTDRVGAGGLEADSPEANEYVRRHNHAKAWAAANRELIAARILERLKTDGDRLLDVCHNQAGPAVVDGCACWIHRKGAAPSTNGPVLIPGSRGAMSYLVLPRAGGDRHAFSVAHGAGRKWSRSESRGRLEKRYSARDLTRTKLRSHVICEDKELLYEEAPEAYKNINLVIDDLVQAGMVDVVATLKPLVTYKVRR